MDFKIVKSKIFRILFCLVFIVTSIFGTGVTSAAAVPILTGASYNIGTGVLTLSGTNFAALGKVSDKKDIDPTKIMLTDGIGNSYTLTTNTPKAAITSSTGASVKVGTIDMTALAKWVDNEGTKTRSGKDYNLKLLPGWNGAASLADFVGKAFSVVSGLPQVTSAAFDYSTVLVSGKSTTIGKLTLTGTGFFTQTKISPKCLTVTDSVYHSYTLTTNDISTGIISNSTTSSISITLNAADLDAVQQIFDLDGTRGRAPYSGDYMLYIQAGWNGASSNSDMRGKPITVSNYSDPTITVNSQTVEIKKPVIARSSKMGYLYLIPSTNDLSKCKKADLDAFVSSATGGSAKAAVTSSNINKDVSIPTTSMLFDTDTRNYKVVAVNAAGVLSTPSEAIITINNVKAPTMTLSPANGSAGKLENSTKVKVTSALGKDTLGYKISTSAAVTPKFMSAAPSGLILYLNQTDITGVDSTNKYIDLYEINSSGKVVKFKEITATSTSIKADTTPPATPTADLSLDKKTVTLTFNELGILTADGSTLKQAVTVSTDGATYVALNSQDTVSIVGNTLIVKFKEALSSGINKIRISKGAIEDKAGNINSDDLTTGDINADDQSGFSLETNSINDDNVIYMGIPFNIRITSATDALGAHLDGSQTVTVTSDKQDAAVFSGSVIFNSGKASVPVSSTAVTTTGATKFNVSIFGVTSSMAISQVQVLADCSAGDITVLGDVYQNFDNGTIISLEGLKNVKGKTIDYPVDVQFFDGENVIYHASVTPAAGNVNITPNHIFATDGIHKLSAKVTDNTVGFTNSDSVILPKYLTVNTDKSYAYMTCNVEPTEDGVFNVSFSGVRDYLNNVTSSSGVFVTIASSNIKLFSGPVTFENGNATVTTSRGISTPFQNARQQFPLTATIANVSKVSTPSDPNPYYVFVNNVSTANAVLSAASGTVNDTFNVNVTGAVDTNGSTFAYAAVTITTTGGGSGITLYNASTAFTNGAASIPCTISTAGAYTLTVTIDGVMNQNITYTGGFGRTITVNNNNSGPTVSTSSDAVVSARAYTLNLSNTKAVDNSTLSGARIVTVYNSGENGGSTPIYYQTITFGPTGSAAIEVFVKASGTLTINVQGSSNNATIYVLGP